jgi:hypothetical protein
VRLNSSCIHLVDTVNTYHYNNIGSVIYILVVSGVKKDVYLNEELESISVSDGNVDTVPSSTTSTFEELLNDEVKDEVLILTTTNDSTGSDRNTNDSVYVGSSSSSVHDSRDSNASFNAAHGNQNQDET